MLSQLYIKNIAVIREATIDIAPKLNVFTGETGSGKTILISAINAVLGERLSKDIIRGGEDKALISALFTHLSTEIVYAVEAMGYEIEDNSLLISREIGSRNSCKLNGRPATLQILREVAPLLIDVHGQKDNHRLLCAENHIAYIDDFGELTPFLDKYRQMYQETKDVRRQLEQITRDDREKEQQTDLLNYQINEISSAGLESGEEEQLLIRRGKIRNAEKILHLITQSQSILEGEEDVNGITAQIDTLSGKLTELSHFLPELEDNARRLEEIGYEIADISGNIGRYLDDIDYEPNELENVEERLDTISRLKRKYGGNVDEILEFLEQSNDQLNNITSSEERVLSLQKKYQQIIPKLQQAADELTAQRHKAARDFLSRVKKELEFLNMPSVKLSISARRSGFKANGQDDMEFLISSNAGEIPKPLAKIASGGELSRVMLSIKNVLAAKDHVGTAIFDEIDTGVSGKAAQKIGQKLKEVSANRQVICVTHLAQVAAFAHHHLLIYKKEQDGRTFTQIVTLSPEDRVKEVARMISGENITDTAVRNAKEMIVLAGIS